MDTRSSNKNNQGLRLKLESLRHIAKGESRAFRNRNNQINRILESLSIQIVAATGSLALLLFLGFTYGLSPILIFTVFGTLSIWILQLKIRAIRISKGLKHLEPEINEGSLLARVRGDSYEFYLIEKKSNFHFYLCPVKYEQILNKQQNHFPTLQENSENKKTLLFHKKRVFESFYIVLDTAQQVEGKHQISA